MIKAESFAQGTILNYTWVKHWLTKPQKNSFVGTAELILGWKHTGDLGLISKLYDIG